MKNIKNKFMGVILVAMMSVSTVGAPVLMNDSGITETPAIVQTITAEAATLYVPSVSGNNYIIGYCTSDSSVPVYADANFKKRGAAASKYGKVSYYNAYISGGSDEVRIFKVTSSYCYVSYPAGKSTKYGYIRTSAVFPMNWTKNKVTSKNKVTTYKKSNLKTSYGYVAGKDSVYFVGQSGNSYKIIYNISGNNWKTAWVSESGKNSILGGVSPIRLSYGLYKNNSARITCGFDGYTTTKGRHEGIDISWTVGKTIYSLTDGVVTRVANGYRGSNGLSTIAIYNASQNKTVIYLHSAPISSIKAGQTIRKGQQIGTQDWRGVSSPSGSHTHVEVRNGKQSYASKSVNDPKLDNSNPTSFWNTMGYTIG